MPYVIRMELFCMAALGWRSFLAVRALCREGPNNNVYASCAFLESFGVCRLFFLFTWEKLLVFTQVCICEGCKFQSWPFARHKAANLSFLRFSPSVKTIHRGKNSFRANILSSSTQLSFDKKSQRQPLLCPQLWDLGLQICYIIKKKMQFYSKNCCQSLVVGPHWSGCNKEIQ